MHAEPQFVPKATAYLTCCTIVNFGLLLPLSMQAFIAYGVLTPHTVPPPEHTGVTR